MRCLLIGLAAISAACMTEPAEQATQEQQVEQLPAPRPLLDVKVEAMCRSAYVAGTATLLEESRPAEGGASRCRVRLTCKPGAAPATDFFPSTMVDAACLQTIDAACAALPANGVDFTVEPTIRPVTNKQDPTCADLTAADYEHACRWEAPVPVWRINGKDFQWNWVTTNAPTYVTCSVAVPLTPVEKACGDASATVVSQSPCKVIPTAGTSNFYLAENAQGPDLPVVFRCDWVQRCDRVVLDRGDVIGPPGETESCRIVPRNEASPKKMCEPSTLPPLNHAGRSRYFSITWYPDTSWLGKLEDAGIYYAGPADGWIRRTRSAIRKELQARCEAQKPPLMADQTADCVAANPTASLPKQPMICCPDTLLDTVIK